MIYKVRANAKTEYNLTVAPAQAGVQFCVSGCATKIGSPPARGRRKWQVRSVLAAVLLAAGLAPTFAQPVTPSASEAQPAASQTSRASAATQSATTTPAAASTQAAAPLADQATRPAAAQPDPAPAPAPARAIAPASYQPPSAPGAFSLLQTLFALCLVLALLAGTAWLLKRLNPRGMGGNATLRVVSALSLGGRERVLVVEVGDQWIVVGAAPGRVNLLTTMPKQEGMVTPPGLVPGVPAGFADWLKQTLEKRNAK
jgi:flagellar protein FliO/FliZ